MREFGVEEPEAGWPGLTPELSLTEHLHVGTPTSASDLTCAALEEAPTNTLLMLVESLPRRAEAVIAA